jgi:hypothetical protein
MTAYLILAFKNPQQVSRLIGRLQSPNSKIFIHIDRKVDISPFLFLTQHPNVRFISERFRIVWGGYSITECLINGMKEILADGHFNHIALLSGQDYVIGPIGEFERMLESNQEYSFMAVEEYTEKSKWWMIARQRYEHYHLSDWSFKGKKYVHKLGRMLIPKRDFIYPDYKLYGGGGSTFCVLSSLAAKYIVDFMEDNTKAISYAKTTFASDEFWFQTILMNSWLRDKVINKSLWYMNWNGTSKHPRILTIFDYKAIVESQMFFARKFDVYMNRGVLDRLDEFARASEVKLKALSS